MTRLAVFALLLILIGVTSTAAAQTLVDLRDLSPRELKMGSFTLDAPQDLRIEAVGAEDRERGRWDDWNRKDNRWKDVDDWPGEAWILDARTREVVWTLREADTDERRGVHAFEGAVRLPAGTYEAYYASYPGTSYHVWNEDEDGDDKGIVESVAQTLAGLFDGRVGRRVGYGGTFVENGAFRDFRLVVRGTGQTGGREALTRAHEAFTANAFVSMIGLGDEAYEQQGFQLNRPTEIEIYALGEARRNEAYDYGRIINADTRETVWTFDGYSSEWAGGSDKNRVVRQRLDLPAGRYAAFYVTDDSHSPDGWNTVPATDPIYWGLTLSTPDRANVALFDYEHVPAKDAFVTLTQVRDDAVEAKGFTLDRRTDVRVYALGEGGDRELYDYGWIVDADTRERVWDMRDEETAHAGGAQKNRVFDGVVTLDAGDYIAYYVTDGSHSYRDWNAAPPIGGEYWGLTLLTADGADRVRTYAEREDPAAIAQITRVRDSERESKRFSLDRPTAVRIYALGEGDDDEMYDYGWIEDERTGRAVWEMTYRTTERAGGARKNRIADVTLTLPAGDYELRYRTDGSHAFGDWNADPPDDPLHWGITVYRADAR